MILQFGTLVSGLFGSSGPAFGAGASLGGLLSRGIEAITPFALGVGEKFATGQINRELNRSSRNDLTDSIKAQLRAASNAVSPTAAVGQTAVPAGGPALGSAFAPATLLPPSIQPPQRILQTDPNFFGNRDAALFQSSRRPPDLFVGQDFPITNAGLGTMILKGFEKFRGAVGPTMAKRARQFDPRTPIGRQMLGTGAAAVALETGLQFGAANLFAPGVAGDFTGIAPEGDPLRITGGPMPATVTGIPTGLPATGVFQKEANGCRVQWFFWNGDMSTSPQPVDRGAADMVKREFIYRLNVFTGRFIRLKSKRMNPMNVRAFFRAGRRVDAGRRICMKMFSEHRRDKKGSVRRKSSKKRK